MEGLRHFSRRFQIEGSLLVVLAGKRTPRLDKLFRFQQKLPFLVLRLSAFCDLYLCLRRDLNFPAQPKPLKQFFFDVVLDRRY
jgi:hypothetical protein